jgi:hypothetical protein
VTGYVFVSYPREELEYVHRLVAHLRAAGLNVWFDQQIPPGDRWPSTLAERIDESTAVVVVSTQEFAESHWAEEELLRAQNQGKAIFPLLLSGPVPFGLTSIQYESVAGGIMPSSRFVERIRALASAAPSSATVPAAPRRVHRPSCIPLAPLSEPSFIGVVA